MWPQWFTWKGFRSGTEVISYRVTTFASTWILIKSTARCEIEGSGREFRTTVPTEQMFTEQKTIMDTTRGSQYEWKTAPCPPGSAGHWERKIQEDKAMSEIHKHWGRRKATVSCHEDKYDDESEGGKTLVDEEASCNNRYTSSCLHIRDINTSSSLCTRSVLISTSLLTPRSSDKFSETQLQDNRYERENHKGYTNSPSFFSKLSLPAQQSRWSSAGEKTSEKLNSSSPVHQPWLWA